MVARMLTQAMAGFLLLGAPVAAFAQWAPGSEIVGQSVQVETNGVTNTIYLDAGGVARIQTPAGNIVPGFLPGVRSSDHWSFWQCRYPALMLTDTAPFRYPFYHTAHDTPDKLSYRALADVVVGLRHAIASLSDTVSGVNVRTSYAKHR